jgi:hypothetical protein
MKEMGVIKVVDQPTDWCHPIVVVKKPNGLLRICIDLTQLNKDTKREFYELPSVDHGKNWELICFNRLIKTI